jgi:formylglycine-generating enzyme required for sulfatase activity
VKRALAAAALTAVSVAAEDPAFVRIPPMPGQSGALLVARTETTVRQFSAFVRATGYRTHAEKEASPRTWKNPGYRVEPKQPVVYVTSNDAASYCEFIGARLPTDAEWEYAAAAGATTRHYWGDAIDPRYLWYRANSDGHPHAAGKKRPNRWGLYDIEGNVWEWAESQPDKDGPLVNRRGGSWIDCEEIDGGLGKRPGKLIGLSTFFKVSASFNHRYDDIGFRCVRAEDLRK